VIEDMTLYDTINNTSITGSYMDFADTQIFINNVSAGLLKTIAKINDVNITATDADDLLYGSADADIIDGLAGHDTIFALAGSDIINGGLGNDEISSGSSDSSLVINFDFIPPDLRETTKQEAFDDDGNPINIVDEYLVNGTADILYGDDGDDSFIMNLNDDFGVQIVKDYQENEVVKIIKDSATIMRVLTTMIDGVNSTLIHDGEMDSAIIIPDYEKEQVRIITSIGG
jgi:Ca2+-binding RTX toxin-like protein